MVDALRHSLNASSLSVDLYKVKLVNEYKHFILDPRIFYDTVVRKSTKISFEPDEPLLEKYGLVIIASPIWIGRLSAPIQELLRRYSKTMKSFMIITTSARRIDCEKIARNVEKDYSAKLSSCFNLPAQLTKNESELAKEIQKIANYVREQVKA